MHLTTYESDTSTMSAEDVSFTTVKAAPRVQDPLSEDSELCIQNHDRKNHEAGTANSEQ